MTEGRIKKRFYLTSRDNPNQSMQVDLDFEVARPTPTNHALQFWPLAYEWRELPPCPHRDALASRLINAVPRLAAALDGANLLLLDPKTPRRLIAVEAYAQRYAQALDDYAQQPDGEAKRKALDYLLKFGLAACESIDRFNAENAPLGPQDEGNDRAA